MKNLFLLLVLISIIGKTKAQQKFDDSSIALNNNTFELLVYPNPVSEILNIKTNGSHKYKGLFYSTNGQLIKTCK